MKKYIFELERLEMNITYKCQTCGAYNTAREAGKDNPKQCYFCYGFDLTSITLSDKSEEMEKNDER